MITESLSHDVSPALAAGLALRPLADTAASTLEWLASATDVPAQDGLTAEREAELLRRWGER